MRMEALTFTTDAQSIVTNSQEREWKSKNASFCIDTIGKEVYYRKEYSICANKMIQLVIRSGFKVKVRKLS